MSMTDTMYERTINDQATQLEQQRVEIIRLREEKIAAEKRNMLLDTELQDLRVTITTVLIANNAMITAGRARWQAICDLHMMLNIPQPSKET